MWLWLILVAVQLLCAVPLHNTVWLFVNALLVVAIIFWNLLEVAINNLATMANLILSAPEGSVKMDNEESALVRRAIPQAENFMLAHTISFYLLVAYDIVMILVVLRIHA